MKIVINHSQICSTSCYNKSANYYIALEYYPSLVLIFKHFGFNGDFQYNKMGVSPRWYMLSMYFILKKNKFLNQNELLYMRTKI